MPIEAGRSEILSLLLLCVQLSSLCVKLLLKPNLLGMEPSFSFAAILCPEADPDLFPAQGRLKVCRHWLADVPGAVPQMEAGCVSLAGL